jgi:hypothetical protein
MFQGRGAIDAQGEGIANCCWAGESRESGTFGSIFPVTSFSHPSFFSLAYSLSIRKTWPSLFLLFWFLLLKNLEKGPIFKFLNSDQIVMIPL